MIVHLYAEQISGLVVKHWSQGICMVCFVFR